MLHLRIGSLGKTTAGALLLLAVAAPPALASEVAIGPAPFIDPALQLGGCPAGLPLLDLGAPISPLPAMPELDGAPTLLAKPPSLRTCACSCGLPCETNDDCGLGGVCAIGITCCALPGPEGDALPDLEPVLRPDTGAAQGELQGS